MADSYIQLPADSTGKKVRTLTATVGADTVHQHVWTPAKSDGTLVDPSTTCTTGTKSNVAGSASSVTVLLANTSRKGAAIFNDSTAILYLDLSGGTASSSSYSVQLQPNQFFELPTPTYTGLITGIWASANGNARVTEFT